MNDTSINFTSYVQTILRHLEEKPGRDYTVFSKSVRKNNGITRTGIVVRREGTNACPVIYVDEFYREGITEKEIREISDALYEEFFRREPEISADLSDFSEFEKARKRLAFKLVSASRNSELLQKTPHKMFYNLAALFYYAVPDDAMPGLCPEESAAILINYHHIRQWGIEPEMLCEAALSNGPILLPGKIESMEEIIGGFMKEEGVGQRIPMFVLSNVRKLFGAACVLYPGILKSFAMEKGQDFYLLPSSVHEMILVPADSDTDPETLCEIVTDINRTQVSPDEVLADSVYFYDRHKDEILWIL